MSANQGDREGRPYHTTKKRLAEGVYSRGDPRGRPEILEQDLAQRWHALPPTQSLPLTGGEVCYLHYAGRSGGPQGPDIRDAVLQFVPAHQHHTDPRYNNVILHVVLIVDSVGPVLRQDGQVIPVCSLNDLVPTIFPHPLWPCQCIIPSMDMEERAALLQRAGMLRFEQKTQDLLELLRASRPYAPFSACDVCLIPALVEAMGYGRDRAFFRAVGQRLVGIASDIPEPAGRAAEPSPLDAERLRTSGKLVEQWRIKGAWETIRQVIMDGMRQSDSESPVRARGRPQGSPPHPTATPAPTMTDNEQDTDRSHSRGGGGVEMGGDPCGRPRTLSGKPLLALSIIDRLRAIFADLGPARADILICNVVLPFAAAVALIEQDQPLLEYAQELYIAYPALPSNQVTRSMYRQLGLEREPKNACQQQGLHYIYAQTCREKRCAACIVVGRDA